MARRLAGKDMECEGLRFGICRPLKQYCVAYHVREATRNGRLWKIAFCVVDISCDLFARHHAYRETFSDSLLLSAIGALGNIVSQSRKLHRILIIVDDKPMLIALSSKGLRTEPELQLMQRIRTVINNSQLKVDVILRETFNTNGS